MPDKFVLLGVYQDVDEEIRSQDEITQLAKMLDIGMKNGKVDIWEYNMGSDKVTLRCNNTETYGIHKSIVTFPIKRMIANVYHDDVHYFQSSIRRIWVSNEPSFEMNFRYVNPERFSTHWLKIVGRITDYYQIRTTNLLFCFS